MVGCACGFDELFGPRDRLVLFDEVTEEGRVRGDGDRRVEVVSVGGPPESGSQVGEFEGEPVVCVALMRAVPQGEDIGLAASEISRVRAEMLFRAP